MNPQEWARTNKKKIAREFIRNIGHETSEYPAAIFTAGLPGAGKTEFTKELLKDISDRALRIDMDEIASLIEGYNPKTADLFRSGASIILDKIYDEVLKAKLDFVMDGTLSHPKALDNIKRALDKGYRVKIYFIHQDPVIAWQFTKDRELVEHRSIDPDKFIETYYKLHDNMGKLQEIDKNVTVSIILKDKDNRVGQQFENINNIYDIIPEPLANDQLRDAIVN
jgi:predicted ABC-type ATPase